jgi:hypothetical protein
MKGIHMAIPVMLSIEGLCTHRTVKELFAVRIMDSDMGVEVVAAVEAALAKGACKRSVLGILLDDGAGIAMVAPPFGSAIFFISI